MNNTESTPDKIVCPHCGSSNCFTEQHHVEISNKTVNSYMCMGCGYTTTTLNIVDGELLKQYEETAPQLLIDLKWTDPITKLVWYPSILNFPSIGIVFPDGVSASQWSWRAAKAVDVPEEDKAKYPIPGQPGAFYTKRVDMESSMLFDTTQFAEACKFIGLIQ